MARPRSLRYILTIATVSLTLFSLIAAVALDLVTSALHRSVTSATDSVESVFLAERMQMDLMLHNGSASAEARRETERDLLLRLDEARRYLTTERERALLERAAEDVRGYIAQTHGLRTDPSSTADIPGFEDAFASLRKLVHANVSQARLEQQSSARLDRLATLLATSVAILLVLSVGVILWWLNRRAFKPVFRVSQAMERFGRGDRTSRAPEVGPTEMREIALRFNDMATALGKHAENQLAFIGSVAHDLRNPLSTLKLSTAMLQREPAPLSEERVRQVLALVRRQVDRLDRLVGDLLDTVRIESGKIELRLEDHDARELVGEVVALFEGAMADHDLQIDLPPGPLPIHCDRTRVEQVLNNLVSNAIKYSPAGTTVTIRAGRTHGRACVSVSDQGIGIGREDQAHLFEPFRRLPDRTGRIPGVGLGLFVARRIVEAHGGQIELESDRDVGTTFKVWLPEGVRPHAWEEQIAPSADGACVPGVLPGHR